MGNPETRKDAPNQSKTVLLPIDQVLPKMLPEEKAQYDKLLADYKKADDKVRPVLRELSDRRKSLQDTLGMIESGFLFNMGATAGAIAGPWVAVPASLANLDTIVEGIMAKKEKMDIDQLDAASSKLEAVCNSAWKDCIRYQNTMRRKYSPSRS